MRWNPEGIRRDQLIWALTQAHIVPEYVKIDACMLCRANRVNDAGLCRMCYALLDGAEIKVAVRWMNGVAP
jgi:hypothetical protein